MFNTFKSDYRVNRASLGFLLLASYRVTHYFSRPERGRLAWLLRVPLVIVYRFVIQPYVGCEVHERASIGNRVRLAHCVGLVIHPNAVIGDDVVLRQSTTIGNDGKSQLAPRIGVGVNIGCGVVLIGDITIGSGSIIGAGSVVLKSFGEGVLIAGNPAIVKKQLRD